MQLLTILATYLATLFVTNSGPGEVRDAFYRAKIVPDVLPAFNPTLDLYIEFDKVAVYEPGPRLHVKDTDGCPTFVIHSSQATDMLSKYVVAMVDPDAYYPDNSSVSQVRHYLGANLTVGGIGSFWTSPIKNLTEPITNWMSPSPPDGSDPHRYVVLVYQQPWNFTLDDIKPYLNSSSERENFNLTSFASAVGLAEPVGGTYFLVGPDGSSDSRK
ncbi:phosphatidylethanolamine-binding protein [Schizophyllum amplum]|uniref:Phosphatidylethanolamine-binding protein n=1 Tax=Schizophyllum amplum TaxID=97359 RepID=A0A550D042_9AGAR|nr:phosphatidylethanolamine-binding protein [Auriculariopsis ampla]